MSDHELEEAFDRGLLHDLRVLEMVSARRRVLGWIGALGLLPLIGCGSSGDGSAEPAGASGVGGATADSGAAGESSESGSSAQAGSGEPAATCGAIPEETAGPYPGDGTNGPNALVTSGIVRDDITSCFGGLSGTAAGVPLTIQLTLVSASAGCTPLSGYAIYVWHCDRSGQYSMYTVTDQNYLRGVQETDADGRVTFTSIFPACYSGRWPHIHFEIFESLEEAGRAGRKLATSQLALPESVCAEVFATSGYDASIRNFSQVSLATDMVFSDGASSETPTVTGNVQDGYVASLTVGVPS